MALTLDQARDLKPNDVLQFNTEDTFVITDIHADAWGVSMQLRRLRDGLITFATASDMDVCSVVTKEQAIDMARGLNDVFTPEELEAMQLVAVVPESIADKIEGLVNGDGKRYEVQAFELDQDPAYYQGDIVFANDDVDACQEFIEAMGEDAPRKYLIWDTESGDFTMPEKRTTGPEISTKQADDVQDIKTAKMKAKKG